MKASAVSKDLRTPKYKMRVEKSVKVYERNTVEEKKEIANLLNDEKYDEYDVD